MAYLKSPSFVGGVEIETVVGSQQKVDTHANRKDNPHEVTPAQIGAAPAVHTHSASQITSGTVARARLPSASTSESGIVQLTSSLTSTSETMAATAFAVSTLKNEINSKANVNHTHSASHITSGTIDIERLPWASTSLRGVVQLEDSVTSTRTDRAATPNSVRQAYSLASGKADANHTHNANAITSGTISTARLPQASTSNLGIVQLHNGIESTSSSLAATAGAVKQAADIGKDRVSRFNEDRHMVLNFNGTSTSRIILPVGTNKYATV